MHISIKFYLVILYILSSITAIYAQQINKAYYGPTLLKNGTIHTITNGTFKGDILINGGIIEDIGINISELPEQTITVDAEQFHVYPGFIDGGCRLGLSEVGSVSLTNDYNELGDFIPHMRALTAVNPNAVAIPVTRVNGVTTVFTKPENATFPGTGALINLWGYTPEQMYAGASYVIMEYPSSGRRGRWDNRTEEDIKNQKEKNLKKLDDIWQSAKEYYTLEKQRKEANIQTKAAVYNPQMDALLPILDHTSKLIVEVNKKEDILEAINWVKKFNIPAIFSGVDEGWKVADSLAQHNISVIVGPVMSIPGRTYDRYDVNYKNASRLKEAGVKIALRTNQAENVRNLPFEAGFAATYGLGTEEALKAITITPAEIFGVSHLYGSIEKGKIANLFVSTGDPFEMKTKIVKLYINGWDIPLENRQTYLNDEFLNRQMSTHK